MTPYEGNAKTVLVTGASGYIGNHVVNALQRRGARVIGLDVKECSGSACDETITADLFAPDFDLFNLIDQTPDACIHLAWRNGFSHNALTNMEDLSSHFTFVRKLIDIGVPQVAVMGTMHEVGYWEGAVDASTPCNPQSLYGIAKDALRRSTFQYAEGKETAVLWLRGFYIYGNDLNSQSIFGKIARAAQEGEKTFPFTTGKNLYDFLLIDELAEQISACLMQEKVEGIINCCSGNPISLAEQVESFISKNELDIKLEYGVYPDRPYDSPGIWGDASIINEILHTAK